MEKWDKSIEEIRECARALLAEVDAATPDTIYFLLDRHFARVEQAIESLNWEPRRLHRPPPELINAAPLRLEAINADPNDINSVRGEFVLVAGVRPEWLANYVEGHLIEPAFDDRLIVMFCSAEEKRRLESMPRIQGAIGAGRMIIDAAEVWEPLRVQLRARHISRKHGMIWILAVESPSLENKGWTVSMLGWVAKELGCAVIASFREDS